MYTTRYDMVYGIYNELRLDRGAVQCSYLPGSSMARRKVRYLGSSSPTTFANFLATWREHIHGSWEKKWIKSG